MKLKFPAGVIYRYNRTVEMGWWELDEVFGSNEYVVIGYLIVDIIPFVLPGIVVLGGTVVVLVRDISLSVKLKI